MSDAAVEAKLGAIKYREICTPIIPSEKNAVIDTVIGVNVLLELAQKHGPLENLKLSCNYESDNYQIVLTAESATRAACK